MYDKGGCGRLLFATPNVPNVLRFQPVNAHKHYEFLDSNVLSIAQAMTVLAQFSNRVAGRPAGDYTLNRKFITSPSCTT